MSGRVGRRVLEDCGVPELLGSVLGGVRGIIFKNLTQTTYATVYYLVFDGSVLSMKYFEASQNVVGSRESWHAAIWQPRV